MRPAATRLRRRLAIMVGVLALGYGGTQLLTLGPAAEVGNALAWLAAVLFIHDGVLGPLVAATGALLARPGRRPGQAVRGGVRPAVTAWLGAGLAVAAVVVLLALPVLLSPGAPDNPTVLPRPYPQGLAVLLGLDAAVTVAGAAVAGAAAGARRRRGPGS